MYDKAFSFIMQNKNIINSFTENCWLEINQLLEQYKMIEITENSILILFKFLILAGLGYFLFKIAKGIASIIITIMLGAIIIYTLPFDFMDLLTWLNISKNDLAELTTEIEKIITQIKN